jgi:hypothetical protein
LDAEECNLVIFNVPEKHFLLLFLFQLSLWLEREVVRSVAECIAHDSVVTVVQVSLKALIINALVNFKLKQKTNKNSKTGGTSNIPMTM